jgi:hypothetical protein
MSHNISSRSRTTAGVALLLVLASVLLAACGSSSSTTSTAASATQSASTTGTPTGGAGGAGRFSALRECLAKQGITLPKFTPGQHHTPGAGGLLGGGTTGTGPKLPSGVTRAQYEAAIKKCGGTPGRFGGGAGRFRSPAFKTALTKFSACMNENGVKLPAPNTSGTGPVFNTTGIDTASASFKTAEAKCASVLRASLGAGAQGGGVAGSQSG